MFLLKQKIDMSFTLFYMNVMGVYTRGTYMETFILYKVSNTTNFNVHATEQGLSFVLCDFILNECTPYIWSSLSAFIVNGLPGISCFHQHGK